VYIARTLDFWFWLNVSPRDGRDMTLAAEGFALAVPDMILYNCDRIDLKVLLIQIVSYVCVVYSIFELLIDVTYMGSSHFSFYFY